MCGSGYHQFLCGPFITGCCTFGIICEGGSLMFPAGEQLGFTGRQNVLKRTFLLKILPLDGQARQAKSSSQLVNLHGCQPLMKPLMWWVGHICIWCF